MYQVGSAMLVRAADTASDIEEQRLDDQLGAELKRSGERGPAAWKTIESVDVAKDVGREFASLYLDEPIDVGALRVVVDEWTRRAAIDKGRRGGRAKNGIGKYNALATAIASTSFRMNASGLEQVHKDWKKRAAKRAAHSSNDRRKSHDK